MNERNPIDPVAVILVSSGSRGDKLLFRYPVDAADDEFESVRGPGGDPPPTPVAAGSNPTAPNPPNPNPAQPEKSAAKQQSLNFQLHHNLQKNPYSLPITEDIQVSARSLKVPKTCIGPNGTLTGFSDKILATLLAVKQDLCGVKFELKVNDVVFVGHPKLLDHHHGPACVHGGAPTTAASHVTSSASTTMTSHLCGASTHDSTSVTKKEVSTLILFNVVFVLAADASFEIRNCIHQLALSFAAALAHEERRNGFLTREAKAMIAVHDEVTSSPSAASVASAASGGATGVRTGNGEDAVTTKAESPFKVMLSRCRLARNLANAFESLKQNGVVQLYVNHWIPISFCLPHKVHMQSTLEAYHSGPGVYGQTAPNLKQLMKPYKLSNVLRALAALQPYHALLLLEDCRKILDQLPIDCSPALARIIKVISPLKKLETLATDSDLALSQVFQIASHLVYWGKATVVYPLCENNVYVISPKADPETISSYSKMTQDFFKSFSRNLQVVLSEFSLPMALGDQQSPHARPQEQTDRVQLVIWLLQRRLLQQLHTYVYVLIPNLRNPPGFDCKTEPKTTSLAEAEKNNGDAKEKPLVSANGSQGRGLGVTTNGASMPAVSLSDSPNTNKLAASYVVGGDAQSRAVRSNTSRTQDTLLTELSAAERQAVLTLNAANSSEDLRLFAKLLKYFRGQHHLEEIMYYENISRSQILTIIDKFRHVLVTCLHPDPVTAVFLD